MIQTATNPQTRSAFQEQLRLIEAHRVRLCSQHGRDVSAELAASDWIGRYAAVWRAWWESGSAELPFELYVARLETTAAVPRTTLH